MPVVLGLGRTQLLRKCIQLIDTFDPRKTTVDVYVQDAEMLKDKSLGDVEMKFIHQVFYGCNRYQKFLKLFVTSFMYKCPTQAVRTEQTAYQVLAYLLFFRLEELGVPEFRLFLGSGVASASALLALLQFALSVEDLEKWVKMEWCKLYDITYIENEIVDKLQRFAPDLKPLVDEVEFKATGTVSSLENTRKTQKRRTSPKPFSLTQPKPRLVPEPEMLKSECKARPAPADSGPCLAQLEEVKKKRLEEEKARVAAKYADASVTLESDQRGKADKMDELTKQVEAERMAECTFAPKTKKYQPRVEEAVVRPNAAAVLREDALLRQKQAKEYQVLKQYEEGLRDASDYHRWQQEMKEKDRLEEELRTQQRIVEMSLARESAIEAQESEKRKKNIVAQHQREESRAILEAREHGRASEIHGKQQLVEQTQKERENAREAEADVLKARAEVAEQMRRAREGELERKRQEDELEMERRRDLIRQIHALEKVPVEKFKQFDPSESPDKGLLEEMSLAELRERLKIVTAQREREIEDKRGKQLEKKMERQQELQEKAETLAKIKDKAKEESQQRRDAAKQRQKEIDAQQQQHREQCLRQVQSKLQMKKQRKHEAELKLKKELKEIAAKRQFMVGEKEKLDAMMLKSQEEGFEREAREREKKALAEQRATALLKNKDSAQRHLNAQREQDEYRAMCEEMDQRVERAKAANATLKGDITRINMLARTTQKAQQEKLAAELGHSASKYSRLLAGN